jgi:predicted ATPase
MRERGDLVRDEEGRWVEALEVDWGRLPPRVEATIAERINRLPGTLQSVLKVASVEGGEFTAEVVAQVLGIEDQEIYRRLSGSLSREHQLVAASSLKRQDGRRLSRYRFRHQLFQEYLYGRLDEVEQAHRHEAVGEALEELYGGDRTNEIALQLARHFELAGIGAKAAGYLLRAGSLAMEMRAPGEGVEHFRRGLELLTAVPESPDRDRQEIDLQLSLGSAMLATEGMGGRARVAAYSRAYELSQRLGERVQQWPALHALAASCTSRGEYGQALELGEQLLDVAGPSAEPAVVALAHFTLGSTFFSSGASLVRSREHLEQAILYYGLCHDPEQLRFTTSLNVFDVGVNARAWLSNVLWILGYPDQALRRSEEALELARQLDHFLSKIIALYAAAHTRQHRGEYPAMLGHVQELESLVKGKQLLIGDVWVDVFGGWLLAHEGHIDEGLAQLHHGIAAWEKSGAVFGTTSQLILLAEALLLSGRTEEGLETVDKALAFVERTGARPNEADVHRLKGELLVLRGESADAVEAEACLRQAVDVARGGEQKGWELRAATSLARLLASQGRREEGRGALEEVCGWFTEAFEMPDLQAARRLLGELATGKDPKSYSSLHNLTDQSDRGGTTLESLSP